MQCYSDSYVASSLYIATLANVRIIASINLVALSISTEQPYQIPCQISH